MATLGIVLLWGGYTIGVFGFAKIKSAYGLSPSLSVSDLALPSHRATYLAAATTWGGSSSSSSTAAPSTGTAVPAGAPAKTATTSTVPTPIPTATGGYFPPL
jgi:hypothetical protein